MSDVFFSQLDIPEPDVNLDVGSASHSQQTAEIMRRFEPVVLEKKPGLVLVYGECQYNGRSGFGLRKTSRSGGHVEAGLRSFDRTTPQEINRT